MATAIAASRRKPATARLTAQTWGGVSSDAVAKATGRTWAQWIKALDARGCTELTHKEIAVLAGEEFGLAPWWRQMVTVGYEQARGLRVANQKCDGRYSVSASRTMKASTAGLSRAWTDARMRSTWLGTVKVEITTAKSGKSIRMKWLKDDTRVVVMFYPRPGRRTQMTIEHNKLAEASDVQRRREFWAERLDALQSLFEKPGNE